jgi:flagellar basal-body rod protein FlgF
VVNHGTELAQVYAKAHPPEAAAGASNQKDTGAMDNLMLIGLARQQTLRQAMDVAANNIANASTTGFKAERVMLEEHTDNRARHADGPDRVAFVHDWAMGRNFEQGALTPTGRALDLALDGEGFFTLETDAGSRFTRDGNFTLGQDGMLSTASGARVLDDAGQPIMLDPAGGPINIGPDGAINQGGPEIARLGIARFENLAVLSKTGDNHYAAPDNAEQVFEGLAQVRQGYSEASNVRAITEITRMMEVSRAYASVSKMIRDADELSRKAIDRLGRP